MSLDYLIAKKVIQVCKLTKMKGGVQRIEISCTEVNISREVRYFFLTTKFLPVALLPVLGPWLSPVSLLLMVGRDAGLHDVISLRQVGGQLTILPRPVP